MGSVVKGGVNVLRLLEGGIKLHLQVLQIGQNFRLWGHKFSLRVAALTPPVPMYANMPKKLQAV